MNHNPQLIDILKGCLNSSTVQMAQNQLVDYSRSSNFIPQLLQLIPNQPNDLVIMILSTVKNFCQENYTHPQNPIPEEQKQVLRDNLFNLFYIINTIPQAVNMYKQIVYIVVSVDYERYNDTFYRLLKDDLDGSISASAYFCRQVTRFYEWLSHEQKEPLERFTNDLFPRIQQIVVKIISEYNNTTRVLLLQILEMFYSAFHVDLPVYLRDFNNLDKWILYISTIFQAPINDFPDNHIIVSKIYVKLFSMYCKDGTDGKNYRGWGAKFRQKYAVELYNQVIKILVNPVSQVDVMANIPSCLCSVVNNPDLKGLIQEDHCQAIIYKHLLPFMESTQQDLDYFKNDSLEYIRRIEDLTCHPFRRTSLDLIRCISQKLNFGNKSELIKFVQYSASVFSGNYSDKQKQVIMMVLIELEPLIMRNSFLKDNFENLVIQFFIPLVKNNNNIIVSQTLKLLSVFLKSASLSTNTVTQLMGLLYDKMCADVLVVRYHAVLAFTKLLDDKQALQSARPHFQQILKIYVKLLEVVDHEGLISSLQLIIKAFSSDIVQVAQNLVNHLFNLFYSLHNKQSQENNDDDVGTQSKQASAALSTIKQILQSPLSPQTYFNISQKIMILLQHLTTDYDQYFEEILNVLNTLVYKSGNIVNHEFPYLLCLKLLEGNNAILNNCQNKDFANIISEAEKADTEYSQSLISILKNLIQKMPEQILHQYPYSTNPELILCMIENKKLNQSQLNNLNTSDIDIQWRLILQSYTSVAYGFGQVCPVNDLKMLTGISLSPWIECNFDLEVVKKVMNVLLEEEAEDEYYEQNTVQMLQKFANQDDDEGDYYISSGGNYSYMYDSPYDCTKDVNFLVKKLKSLPQNQFNYIFNNLKPKMATKLQILLKQ